MPEQQQDGGQSAYMPPGPPPLLLEHFEGINTSTTRPGVPDKQCYWIDGFMPLSPRNLRTLPGSTIIHVPSVSFFLFGFFNIGSDSFAVIFFDDGSVGFLNTTTFATGTILAAGTITDPSSVNVGFCNYGNQYLLIVAEGSSNPNGYWLWDGTTVYTAGTLSPVITLTDTGAGYQTTPTVQISGGSGGGAVLAASIADGMVTDVTVVDAGSGYLAGDIVTLTFSGGNTAGSGGNLTAVLSNSPGGSGANLTATLTHVNFFSYAVTSVTVNAGGSGYSQFTTITAIGGSQTSAPVLVPVITAGVITSVTIVNGGAMQVNTPFSLSISDAGGFYVSSITINNGGSGYSPSATVTASGGGSPISQASLTLTITAGVITAVPIQNSGLYGSNTPPTLTIVDTLINATATAELMPFAISGTTIQTYSGHIWIADGASFVFSAPGSISDFSTSNGGGSQTTNDSSLQNRYTRLISANGFLWLVGDSSLSYISGVQTGGSPIETTFTLQNADPEVGSPWPYSVSTFGRDIVFANSWGVHIGYGSSVQKISEPLDGVWDSLLPTLPDWQTSFAKATIYNRKVIMFLVPITNPITEEDENKLLLWDGKRWWASSQNVTLTNISWQETDSKMAAWGTDGSKLYKLFQTPTTSFTKRVQSRLWDIGGYWLGNAITRFWSMVKNYRQTATSLTVTIDNEDYPSNAQSNTISVPIKAGIDIAQPQAVGQQGALAGLTISTDAADISIISAAIKPEITQYRG